MPRAVRTVRRFEARVRTARTMASPGARLLAPSSAFCTSGSAGRPSARAESMMEETVPSVVASTGRPARVLRGQGLRQANQGEEKKNTTHSFAGQ
jgi:hypothetical protein